MKPSEKVIDLFQKVILGNDNSAKHQIISIVRDLEQALEEIREGTAQFERHLGRTDIFRIARAALQRD